jgi:uncharacterized membrane protein YccF (DUF307 family)
MLCLTIIGIPWGIAAFKMVPLTLTPLGHRIVSASELAAPVQAYSAPYGSPA